MLMNYVELHAGIPARMHFTDDYDVVREILVKETGNPKKIRSLIFQLDELNGEESFQIFSILSEKLRAHFTPYLPEKKYLEYDFLITEMGSGFYKDWNVQVIKRA